MSERAVAVDERPTEVGVDACPECGGLVVEDDARGETACRDCGLVITADHIDRGPIWTKFDRVDGDNPKRHHGTKVTERLHDKGLQTNIGNRAKGNLSRAQRRRLGRIKRQEQWAKVDSNEEGKAKGLGYVQLIASNLGLSESLVQRACRLFREAHDNDMAVGLSLERVAAVAVLGACREFNRPITADEIAATTPSVSRTDIWRKYRQLIDKTSASAALSRPVDYIPRFCSELETTDDVARRSEAIARDSWETGYCGGKRPKCIAAAAIYLAGLCEGPKITQEHISRVADVSNVSIRKHYQGLRDAGCMGCESDE